MSNIKNFIVKNKRNKINLNNAFQSACEENNIPLINFLITLGTNKNIGLYTACCEGNLELAHFMISTGANDWIAGYYGALIGGSDEIKIFIIELMKQNNKIELIHGFLTNSAYGYHVQKRIRSWFKDIHHKETYYQSVYKIYKVQILPVNRDIQYIIYLLVCA